MRRRLAALAVAALSRWRRGADEKPAAAPRIRVEPESFDFGKAQPGKTLRKDFTIRNFGDAALVIEGVSTTCGCTAALSAQSRVEPGGRTVAAGHVRDPHFLGEGGEARARPLERPEDASSPGAGERDGGASHPSALTIRSGARGISKAPLESPPGLLSVLFW